MSEREAGKFTAETQQKLYDALPRVEAEMQAGLGSSYGETRVQVRAALAAADGERK
jgi:hypothetical protein